MRIRSKMLGLLAAALAAGSLAAPAGATDAEVTVFAGGGTPLSNGIFFPGTTVYDGTAFVGEPIEVPKGSDLNLTMVDEASVANGHAIVSLKLNRRTKRPLFRSGLLTTPGQQEKVVTSHLKPGVYYYRCPIHDGMYGAIEVV